MGAAFYSPGTGRIRDELNLAFSPANVAGTASSFAGLFRPSSGDNLTDIIDAMDLPPANDVQWPTLHPRFKTFLQTLYSADPTTHDEIKAAILDALTNNTPPCPIAFHVSHQAAGYKFVWWYETDNLGINWQNCLLYCPTMKGKMAKRLRRVIGRKR